ncbi:MAG: ice-binding family protein [Nonlabens sp.]|uniref:ice-binding family protein n=1 Tax=Nonlabens sp. TaxID=1888209 RepID=UPI0035A6F0BF
MLQFAVQAQSIKVTGVSSVPVCSGTDLTITFTSTNGLGEVERYSKATSYTIYLSNSSGTDYAQLGSAFQNVVANYSSDYGGTTVNVTVRATIPADMISGNGYKVALGSTGPTFDGSDGTGASVPFEIIGLPVIVSSISGVSVVCEGQSDVSYSILAMDVASSYTWAYSGTGATISGTNEATITFRDDATSGNLSVKGTNSCGSGSVSSDFAIEVVPISVGGIAYTDQRICSGTVPLDINLTGQNGAIQWQSSTDNTTFTNITSATSPTLTGAQMEAITVTTYYQAVVTNGVCNSVNSNTVTVEVDALSVGGAASSDQTVCIGTVPDDISLSGETGTIQWQSSTDNATFTTITSATGPTLTGTQMGSISAVYYYRAIVTNGVCNAANSNTVTVKVATIPTITGTTAGFRYAPGTVTLGATASAGVINWYAAASGGEPLASGESFTTAFLASSTSYYVDATAAGCTAGTRTEVIASLTIEDGRRTLNLGALTLFAAYSASGAVSNTGTSTVRCNVGSNEGAVTGFGAPTQAGIIYNANSTTAQAKIDLLRVYIHLSDLFVTNTSHAAAFGAGETITPGIYSIGGAGSLGGSVTLDGRGDPDAAFIIKFEGAFTVGASSKVILTNGTRSCNVFWIAQGAIAVGASCAIKGSLLSYPGAISVTNGTNLEGRMLANSGALDFGPGELLVPEGPISIPIKCVNSCNNNILGSISDWALFTSSGAISNEGPSGLVGNIGSNAGVISGFTTSTIVGSIHNNDDATEQAAVDLQLAYDKLIAIPNTKTHADAFGGGETLTAGVYALDGAGSLAGTLTLDGQNDPDALFIFKMGGAFAVAAKAKVIFTNGVSRCNVFWVAEGAISVGSFCHMKGTLLSHNGAVNMGANGNLEGRMLSTTGAIGISTGVIYTNSLCFEEPVNKWNGLIDTKYNSTCNWTQNFLPEVDGDIIFDDAPVNDCFLDKDRSITDITNAQSTYGIVLNSNTLALKGNLLFSNGAAIDGSSSNSTMQYSGSKVQTINSTEFKNDAVYNLTIDNTVAVNIKTNFAITDELVINSGKKLFVSSVNQLSALGTITNNGGAAGLVLRSDPSGTASLLHNTDNVPATVQRYISGPVEGWHFLSSAVSGQDISGSWLPGGTYGNGTGYDMYLWDEPSFSFKYKLDNSSIGWKSVHEGTDFSIGRGYLYSVQATNPTKEFKGNLNNGLVNYPITMTDTEEPELLELKGFNLVGNPYPSSIDWQASSGWDRSTLEESAGGNDMWVWNPTAKNYGVFNSASGVGTNRITRYLAPMQGYFVRSAITGNLLIDNNTRVHTGAGNWFKNAGIKNGIIRIAVQSENGSGSDEALIEFGYTDSKKGTLKLFSHVVTAPSLYMNSSSKSYSVRYLTDTAENAAVDLEFKAGKNGFYNLAFNFDAKEFDFVQLEDRHLNTSTVIKPESVYRFKAATKENANRFVVHFTEASTTVENELAAFVYMDGSALAVDLRAVAEQTEITVFDISGKLLLRKDLDGLVVHKLKVNATTQILLVHLRNEKGVLNTKVVYAATR